MEISIESTQNLTKMLSSSNSKNSSDDDDGTDELVGLNLQTKHFLDYAMDPSSENDLASSHSKNTATKSTICIDQATKKAQIDIKKKLERGQSSTSQTAISIDQLNLHNTKSTNLPNNVDAVYSILSMLGSINSADITSKFLEFSKNREMCSVLRLSGCISLLVQIIHSEPYDAIRQKECVQALHNIINCHNDDKVGRREIRVLKLNEQLLGYCDSLRSILKNELSDNIDRHPIQAIGVLMKISFDEDHRYAMCQLGALQTISTLIQLDHEVHGPVSTDINCITLRRYAGMCLTNLTFGDGNNKALLCSNKNFMKALVTQVNSSSDELVQVTASVIRNLSWRADIRMKEVLNEIGTVKILTLVAMKCSQENTLKAILSALWNLSNHCAKNKAEICEIRGAIEFLVDMLLYEAASKTTSVIENAGGILRNVSTHIALHEECRIILRRKNCLTILLQQLKSPSLTVVSNACGTLGNLSSHSTEDQKFLRENGAIPMLRSLIYSKHKMISTGSTIALRHLLSCKSNVAQSETVDSVAKMMDLKELPTLNVRKQKALEHELSLSHENYKPTDNDTPDKDDKLKDSNIKVQDIEDEDEEAPTNFSKFDDDQEQGDRAEYQETNLDQITDYSIRYAENQSDSEEDVAVKPVAISSDDTMKCYNTEGTPHTVLSGAASLSDLRKEKLKAVEGKKFKGKYSAGASGLQSPEKTVNYCVEGTPGNFSRNDSLSDLEETKNDSKAGSSKTPTASSSKVPPLMIRKDFPADKESIAATPKSVTFLSLAEETPLMFSRTSSMGSLSSAEPACMDDKSSVFSDFSRLASGIISPSELPDSPTQSVPQSPSARNHFKHIVASRTPPLPSTSEIIGVESADDSINTFHIENTPAPYSYAASSLSNLSFDDEPKISTDAISKDFQLMKHPSCEEDDGCRKVIAVEENPVQSVNPPDTADQSDVESADDDILLESCINIGMNRVSKPIQNDIERSGNLNDVANDITCIRSDLPKCSPLIIKENPIDMMRSGAPLLPPYLPVVDELNRYIVEDSPCNFSLMSGLSAITMESNTVQQSSNAKFESNFTHDKGSNKKKLEPPQGQEFNDSLSSLSIESEDDGNLLSQAIAAGANKPLKKDIGSGSAPINIPLKPSGDLCNDSISSVDSCGRDDASNSILEQCIQSGINKVIKKDSSSKLRERTLVTSSPKKSLLPTYSNKPGSSKPLKSDKKVQVKRDEALLMECINTGIQKNTRQDQLVENIAQLTIKEPKNVETTSVIALDKHPQCVSTVADVEVKAEKNITMNSNVNPSCFFKNKNETPDQDGNSVSKGELSHQGNWTVLPGCSTSFELNLSLGSMEENILERSNEYPASKLPIGADAELDDDSMNVSNEFMMEHDKLAARIEDKHKDPDLMMKSVDRLTQELISTAEYLRKNAAHSDEISKMSGSNTWNDENSFPSITMSAPMIESSNDEATFATDQVHPMQADRISKNEKLDDKTPTNEKFKFNVQENDESNGPRIEFKVGGEIGPQSLTKINFISYGPTSIETCSTMSNSTIVQVEAKRIANKLTSMTNKLMDSTSSLNLENVRPPSSMDCISLSSFQESSVQQSPLKKKSLMTGLVAKRALGHQTFSASTESVNSILNIESIRPPSIMDELLDSMISVDSIVSEIVDPTNLGISNYETALSDMEDSLTLRSCQDFSKDEGTLTATSSDFSSVESTPRKKNTRSNTPKQKRQLDRDRYKTYTIQVDMLLKEQQKQENSGSESMKKCLNARQRRQEDRQRFETQIIKHSPIRRKDDPERFKTYKIDLAEIEDDLSLHAMTNNFEFIRNGTIPNSCNVDTTELQDKLNRIRSGNLQQITDDSLEYERQNSETESQRDLINSLSYEANLSAEGDSVEKVKSIRTGKNSYISPYRMTTRITPMKSKTLKITKTPIKVLPRNSLVDLKPSSSKVVQKKLSTNRLNLLPKGSSNQTNISQPASASKDAPTMPIRQGTFVQDEPTLENVPVVNDLPPSPVKTTLSKLRQPTKLSNEKKVSPKQASNLPTSVSQLKYRSNSNASMKIPVMTPVRSNTGINLHNPKKNISSKIAGIWKSVDKKESLLKKPIVSSSTAQLNFGNRLSALAGTNAKRVGKSSGKEVNIKRSSTFDEIV